MKDGYHSSVKHRLPHCPPSRHGSAHSGSDVGEVSKSQRKREMTALQALGERIVELTDARLASMPLDDELRDAILEARRISSHEGRRRQLQYVGRLMRERDPGPLRAALAALTDADRRAIGLAHAAERWRERLLAEPEALEAFLLATPSTSRAAIEGVLARARAEPASAGASRWRRQLFRVLRDAMLAETGRREPADFKE